MITVTPKARRALKIKKGNRSLIRRLVLADPDTNLTVFMLDRKQEGDDVVKDKEGNEVMLIDKTLARKYQNKVLDVKSGALTITGKKPEKRHSPKAARKK